MSGSPETPASLLERITAGVLVLVLVALAWMTLAALVPVLAGWSSQEVQVIIVLALLSAALVLVSIVALLHTRGQ